MSKDRGRPAEVHAGWTLTAEAFEQLLTALGPDRNQAAEAYERLRERAIVLLRWWGASRPEELADITFDRVAHKLAGGAPVPAQSLGAYVRGVARLVFYESRRESLPTPLSGVEATPEISTREIEEASACLDRCLTSLDAPERSLLLRYYAPGKASENRARIAADLDITLTALRIRTHRLRLVVERCVTACLARRRSL